MNNNFANKIPLALALATSSVAFGAMSTNERVAQLEQQMKCVYMEVIEDDCDPMMITCGAQTASARPNVQGDQCRCGYGWFVSVDVIYWHPKVGGTEYAYSDNSPQLALSPDLSEAHFPLKGRTKDIDFDWDWGFKVGLGYNFKHDGWDALIEFTRLDSDGSDSTNSGLNGTIVPLRGTSSITNGTGAFTGVFLYCSHAKSEFDVDYDRLDLEMGRNFYVSPKLALRPYAGLTAAWIELMQKTRYFGGEEVTAGVLGLGVNTVHVNDKSHFKGLGPKFGIDTKWTLGHKFSIYGNISGALPYGIFNVTHYEKYSLLEDTNRIKLTADNNRFAPNCVFELGLAYDTYMNENRQHLTIGLGYEAQYWFRANQMLQVTDFEVLRYTRYSEDVSFHGVTLDIRLDF